MTQKNQFLKLIELTDQTMEKIFDIPKSFISAAKNIPNIRVLWKEESNRRALRDKVTEIQKKSLRGEEITDSELDIIQIFSSEQNISKVFNKIAIMQKLKKEELLTQERISQVDQSNPDFLLNFWNTAENYTSEEMQNTWSRLLEKELEKPNSISVATIEAIRKIPIDMARKFNNFCQLLYLDNSRYFRTNSDFLSDILKCVNIDYYILLELSSLGLIHFEENSVSIIEVDRFTSFYFNPFSETGIFVKFNDSNQKKLPVVVLSKVGREIASIIEYKNDISLRKRYFTELKSFWESLGYPCQITINGITIS